MEYFKSKYIPPHVMELIEPPQMIDGVPCKFLGLVMESGALEDPCPQSEFDIINDVTSDDEVQVLSVVKKAIPPLVNIEEETTNVERPYRELSLQALYEKATTKKRASTSKEKSRAKIKKGKSRSGYSSESSRDSNRCHCKNILLKRKNSWNDSSSRDHNDKKRFKKDSCCASAVKQETSVEQESVKQKSSIEQELSAKEEADKYGNICRKYCKASRTCKGDYTYHMNGKRHLKAVKLEIIDKAEDYANPATFLNRYPLPPPNVIRKKVKENAESQRVIEQHVKACPGLEKVIEIQGLHKTHFFCELCEATCNGDSIIPHLTGFRHQLQCLKYFKPEIYESFLHREKREIKGKVIKILKEVEKKRGCGKLTVEKEVLKEKIKKKELNDQKNETSKKEEAIPGPSHRDSDDPFIESYSKTIIPDNSKPDFYCQMCDAHMNSKILWVWHMKGKRHITNAEKDPRDEPSEKKTVLVPNARAVLMDELRYIEEPVIGLDHIRETQQPEVSGAMYNCFLCGACSGAPEDMIDHILSQKHRIKYLEKIDHPDMSLLKEMNMQENRLCSIIEETCAQVESSIGRGNIEVHVTKTPTSTSRW